MRWRHRLGLDVREFHVRIEDADARIYMVQVDPKLAELVLQVLHLTCDLGALGD